MAIHPMLLLFLAIACELTGTTALKYSDGFTRPLPSAIVVVGYGASFYLMSLTLRQIPLGTAYAIWSGVGTAATALIGVWLWREGMDLPRVLGIVLIIAGVVALNAFTPAGAAQH